MQKACLGAPKIGDETGPLANDSERPNGLRVIFVTRVTQGGRKAARPPFGDDVTLLPRTGFVNLLAIRNRLAYIRRVRARPRASGASRVPVEYDG